MPILKLHYYPDACLKRPADRVTDFNDDIKQAAQNLIDSARHYPHVGGFAANQLAIPWHMIVVMIDTPDEEPLILINTTITAQSDETTFEKEACLSFPNHVTARVKRAQWIEIDYQDVDGNAHHMKVDQPYMVRCIQHEMDYLNGKSMIDDLPPLKRKLTEQKIMAWRSKRRT